MMLFAEETIKLEKGKKNLDREIALMELILVV